MDIKSLKQSVESLPSGDSVSVRVGDVKNIPGVNIPTGYKPDQFIKIRVSDIRKLSEPQKPGKGS